MKLFLKLSLLFLFGPLVSEGVTKDLSTTSNHSKNFKKNEFTQLYIDSMQLDPTAYEKIRNQYQLLKRVPANYEKYNVAPWEILKDASFNKAFQLALKSRQQVKVPSYVEKLLVVWNPTMTSTCRTPDGVVVIYEGGKPHDADTDGLRIAYFLNSQKIAMKITSSEASQPMNFGTLNFITLGILDGYLCSKEGDE